MQELSSLQFWMIWIAWAIAEVEQIFRSVCHRQHSPWNINVMLTSSHVLYTWIVTKKSHAINIKYSIWHSNTKRKKKREIRTCTLAPVDFVRTLQDGLPFHTNNATNHPLPKVSLQIRASRALAPIVGAPRWHRLWWDVGNNNCI